MRIFAEIPREGASNDSGVVKNGNFQCFAGYFFVYFRAEARVIIIKLQCIAFLAIRSPSSAFQ